MLKTRITAALILAALGLLFAVQPVLAADEALREVVRLRELVHDIISDLAVEKKLDRGELDDLQDELAQVYRDLDALADRLGFDGVGNDPGAGWQLYHDASFEQYPDNARFDYWTKKADIDLNWGNYGELELDVVNGYQAECLIRDAYDGGVQASVETEYNGDIVIKIQDDLGTHEFLVKNGGLGPVYQRGRGDYIPTKQTQPIENMDWTGLDGSEWYSGYQGLVDAEQIEESDGMEWLIRQYDLDFYDTDDLQVLGDVLRQLPVRSSNAPLGELTYRIGKHQREVDLPDPRFNPVGFVHSINKLYELYTWSEDYELDIY